MNKEKLIYFNTFSNLFILFVLFFGGLIYADTNGVWQYASDTRGGTFGGDEQLATSNFTFINPVYFGQPLKSLSNSSTYFINIAGRTQLNDTALNKLSVTNTNGTAIITTSTTGDGIQASTTATGKSAISAYTTNPNSYSGFFDGNVVINSGNLSVKTVANCNGKLITDVNGKIVCSSINETQNLNQVLIQGNDGGAKQIRNIVDPTLAQDVATKNYVDNTINSISSSSNYLLTKTFLTPGTFTWTVPVGVKKILMIGVGGGGSSYYDLNGGTPSSSGGASASGGNLNVISGEIITIKVGSSGLIIPCVGGGDTWIKVGTITYTLGKGGQSNCWSSGGVSGGAKIPATSTIIYTYSAGQNSYGNYYGKSSMYTLNTIISSIYFSYGNGASNGGSGTGGMVMIKY